ncbi:MAG TPA: hypothetical protein ENN43_04840 [bacterium]|nr:hypothetical protein [bacterium]
MKYLFILFLAVPVPVHAYLDPGTGSYILQMIIAGIAGALLTIKIFWNNIMMFFGKLFKGKKGRDGRR